jgi:hypothetical protein
MMPPWSEIQDALVYAVGIPFGVAVAIMFIFSTVRLSALGAVVAVAAGFVVSNGWRQAVDFRLDPETPLTTRDVSIAAYYSAQGSKTVAVNVPRPRYWLPWVTLLAGLVGVISGSDRTPRVLRMVLLAAVAIIAARLLTSLPSESAWNWNNGLLLLILLANLGIVESVLRTESGGSVAAILTASLFLAGVFLLYTHSARLMDAAVMAGSGVLGVALVCARMGASPRGVGPMVAMLVPALMHVAERTHSSAVPARWFLVAACAPMMLGLVRLLPNLNLTHRRWQILAMMTMLVPIAIAIWQAAQVESLAFGDLE